MTDQIFYEELRATIRDAIASYLDTYTDEELRELATESLNLPPRPTLAGMAPSKRAACQWMQADVEDHSVRYVIAAPFDEDDDAVLLDADGAVDWFSPERVTPRPDLPRMEWPRDTGIPGVAVGVPVTDPDLIHRISDEAPPGTIVVEANLSATVRNGRYWHSAEEGHLTLAEALFHAPHEWGAIAPITVVRWGE